MIFGLIARTKRVQARDLYHACRVLEINARHCAEAYGLQPPAIVVADGTRRLPTSACPVLFVDESHDQQALAEHYFDPIRRAPAARVFVDAASSFDDDASSLMVAAGHEILEAMCDPTIGVWLPHPNPARDGDEVAYECADPVQDTYEIKVDGKTWNAANFVTPYWFTREFLTHPEWLDKGVRFDFAGRLKAPGEIGVGGYAVMRRIENGAWVEWAEDFAGRMSSLALEARRKRDPMARTRKRLKLAAIKGGASVIEATGERREL